MRNHLKHSSKPTKDQIYKESYFGPRLYLPYRPNSVAYSHRLTRTRTTRVLRSFPITERTEASNLDVPRVVTLPSRRDFKSSTSPYLESALSSKITQHLRANIDRTNGEKKHDGGLAYWLGRLDNSRLGQPMSRCRCRLIPPNPTTTLDSHPQATLPNQTF